MQISQRTGRVFNHGSWLYELLLLFINWSPLTLLESALFKFWLWFINTQMFEFAITIKFSRWKSRNLSNKWEWQLLLSWRFKDWPAFLYRPLQLVSISYFYVGFKIQSQFFVKFFKINTLRNPLSVKEQKCCWHLKNFVLKKSSGIKFCSFKKKSSVNISYKMN